MASAQRSPTATTTKRSRLPAPGPAMNDTARRLWPSQPWKLGSNRVGIPAVDADAHERLVTSPRVSDGPSSLHSTFRSTGGAWTPSRRAPPKEKPTPATPDVLSSVRTRRVRRGMMSYTKKFGDYHPSDLPADVEYVRNPFTGSKAFVWAGMEFQDKAAAVAAKEEFEAQIRARNSAAPAWRLLAPGHHSGAPSPLKNVTGLATKAYASAGPQGRQEAEYRWGNASAHYDAPPTAGISSEGNITDKPEFRELMSAMAQENAATEAMVRSGNLSRLFNTSGAPTSDDIVPSRDERFTPAPDIHPASE